MIPKLTTKEFLTLLEISVHGVVESPYDDTKNLKRLKLIEAVPGGEWRITDAGQQRINLALNPGG